MGCTQRVLVMRRGRELLVGSGCQLVTPKAFAWGSSYNASPSGGPSHISYTFRRSGKFQTIKAFV